MFDAVAALDKVLDALDREAREPTKLRAVLVPQLKAVIEAGHRAAEAQLLKDRDGMRCARALSNLTDAVVRAIHDAVVWRLYPNDNPSTGEQLAVVATGGYGRGTMAPGSDIDLLFLLPYKQTAWSESVVEAMLYVLWDLKLKVGHATRSVEECLREARADMTIRTALLEARYLFGTRALFEELVTRFDSELVMGTAHEFVEAKLRERDGRIAKAGSSRYLVEPNVKDGKGGLRDLNTLFWIAKYTYRVRDQVELVAAGLFTAEEYRLFERCDEFLWRVRCHMHFVTRRAEERLSFGLQPKIAERLDFGPRGGLSGVERFMKAYFLIAKDVGDLTAIVCAELEARHAKRTPVLDRWIGKFRDRFRATAIEAEDFWLDHGRVNVRAEDAFERDPVNLLRLFWLADRHNIAIHPDAKRLASRSLTPDRPCPARRRGGQPPLPRSPDLEELAGIGAAADERGRRARPLHPGFRPHRRDDAVQHVPPLHGGRAPAARAGRAGRRSIPAGRRSRSRWSRASSTRSTTAGRSTWRSCCTTSPRAGPRTTPSPAPRSRGSSARVSG